MEEPQVNLSEPLAREAVVALAVARSPMVAIMRHRAKAMVYAGRAEGSLPSPSMSVKAWNLPLARPYAADEAEMYMVEFSQMFPPAGVRGAMRRAAEEEAQAMLAMAEAEKYRVAQRAFDAFTAYAQAFQEQAIQRRQLSLLEQMGRVVQARYSTGGSVLGGVARIDLELAKTQRALSRIQGEIAQARSMLNALLRRPATAALGPPREMPPETVRLPMEELLSRATINRGSSKAADAKSRAAGARVDAAKAEARAPEWMVEFGYWQDPKMRPGFGLSASMSLPWLWGPQGARVSQMRSEEAAEQAAREAESVDAQDEVSEAHARLQAAEEQLLVIHGRALPAARRSIEALTAGYATGNTSLLEWVDAARAVLDFEMEDIQLRAELMHALAALEQAVGAPLPRERIQLEPNP